MHGKHAEVGSTPIDGSQNIATENIRGREPAGDGAWLWPRLRRVRSPYDQPRGYSSTVEPLVSTQKMSVRS